MKNILVTGGAGFIGSNYVRYALSQHPDYRVTVYDRLTYAGNLDNLSDVADRFGQRYAFVRGDICDPANVAQTIREHRIDTIVNFAAETHVDRSLMEPGHFIQTDVYGTYVLLEAAKTFGLERYHQVSSVTGDTPVLLQYRPTGEIALRPIADLEQREVSDFNVLTMTDDYRVEFRPMRRFIKHPVDEVYEVTYNGGGQIRVTASHSVFVLTEDGIVAKPTYALRVGDCLVTFVGDVMENRRAHTFDLQQLLAGYSYEGMHEAFAKRQRVLEIAASQEGLTGVGLRGAAPELSQATSYRLLDVLAEEGYLSKTQAGFYVVDASSVKEGLAQVSKQWWQVIKNKLHIPMDRLTVNPVLMEVFGLYLAEGHCSHTPAELEGKSRLVTFTIGLKETQQLDLLKRCAQEVFGIEVSVRKRVSTYQVTFASRWVHALFSQFGATAESKHLPAWIWTQPRSFIEAFLRGYEGDAARKRGGQRYFTTVNRELAESLIWLARMNDINCLLSTRTVQQIKGKVPPGITRTRQRQFYDMQITAENYRPGESGPWRSPMARCIPTRMVVKALGCYQHDGIAIAYKALVSKSKARALAATFETPPQALANLVRSPIGVAKIKAIRRVEEPVMVYDVSVPGNERFFGGNVPCLLHNTDEVYGQVLAGASKETDPLDPRSPYSASKAGGDLMVNAYFVSFGVPATITRGSNNIGPYQYPEKAVPLFITNVIDDQPIPLYGDGLQQRDYQFVLDHCEGIDVVLHKGRLGEVYNLGTGVETANIVMAKRVCDLLGKPHSLIRKVADRPGHDRRYALDVGKIKGLGWHSRHAFEQALEQTVKWYVDNEWWWRKLKSGEYLEYYTKQYAERLEKSEAL